MYQPTRYEDLFYWKQGPKLWRLVMKADGEMSVIGMPYATKSELLSDLQSQAEGRGFPLK